ncbi:MAG: PilZ domain-containing protein [Congregibacter sp.]
MSEQAEPAATAESTASPARPVTATETGSELAYSDNMAIAWKAVGHDLDKTHLAMVNASNEEFLRAVSVIGDAGRQKEPVESGGLLAQEVHRLDMKLNLVLDLVATLIYHQLDIPQTKPVRVSARGVEWFGDVPPTGSTVYLQLYIQRGLPKPLCCYGTVVSSADEVAQGHSSVDFVGLSGAARSWLEKLIFRHHRREVAYQRSSQS